MSTWFMNVPIGEESYVKLLVFTSSYYSNQPYDLGFTKEVIVYDEWLLKTLKNNSDSYIFLQYRVTFFLVSFSQFSRMKMKLVFG